MQKNIIVFLIRAAIDFALMYLALFLVLACSYHDFSVFPGPQTRQFFFHFSFIQLIWLVLLYAFDFYDIFLIKKFFIFLKNSAIFGILAFIVGASYFYLNLHSLISPKTILFFDVAVFLLFLFLRSAIAAKIAGASQFRKNAAVVGWSNRMEELARDYFPHLNYQITAVFSPGALNGFGNLDIYCRQNDFLAALKKQRIDLVIFALPPSARAQLDDLVSKIDIDTKIISLESFYEEITGKVPLDFIDNVWLSDIIRRVGRRHYIGVKRIFDIIFALVGLIITVIIFPFIALAIKLDSSGPIFYIQKRVGKNGKNFNLYKFRTMAQNAEINGPQWSIGLADPRITRVGKFMRAIHIDEFPQFVNILKGNMSFVGPRPERPEFVEDLKKNIPYYHYRHIIKPGFTGWAQINYKASATAQEAREKFEYDLYYIKNCSFFLDIAIILKTIQLLFR